MKLRQHLLSFLCLFMSFCQAQKTDIIFLSGTDAAHTVDWKFYCTDGQNSGRWTTIPVPSNWELQGFGTYNYGHDWKNDEIKLGKEHGLYKYEFYVPADWNGKKVNIVFDGAMTDTRVKMNGRSAGDMHQGGFNRFRYDITDLLYYGKSNLLEVDVAKHSSNPSVNEAERQADFWIFGGIYRPVFLEVLPPVHMDRTAVNAQADGRIESLITINKPGENHSVELTLHELTDSGQSSNQKITRNFPAGQTEVKIDGHFENVISWNPEKPVLYDLKINLKDGDRIVHQVIERIGFRTVELREHDGIYVNGTKVILKGVNRHSFWPETGRALSEENHLMDIRLMKEMNMNAVRMSHYCPDKRFLELCDSLGLFVLDELAGWQDGYDTVVGPKLVRELILKDENHPSVIMWDHGNEGGWNFANEKWFYQYDIQKRPVIYPWLLRNGIDTHHYPPFQYGINRFVNGNTPFMPTEFLHGLYDGGHGAGLESYWRTYESSPMLAGAFLWVFSDEAVLRTDKPGKELDGDGHHAPDGIVGPYREKEGSFFTVKEIWSPVQVKPVTISPHWDGKLLLENKFHYTNLSECTFSWATWSTRVGNEGKVLLDSAAIVSPIAEPGETVWIQCVTDESIANADLFTFTARDHRGKELYTWSWHVHPPADIASRWVKDQQKREDEITVTNTGHQITASVAGLQFTFNQKDGTIETIKKNGQVISLSGGPRPVGIQSTVTDVSWGKNEDGDFILRVQYDHFPNQSEWNLHNNGLLSLKSGIMKNRVQNIDYLGISFYYPEEECKSITWMGRGPYRVWKNRTKGSNIGVWQKDYNKTITGESFETLIYPEFKGYHGDLYWARLESSETPFTIVTETPGLYFQLFKPDPPEYDKGGTSPPFPDADLSFLYDIPAVGTKFKKAEQLGPGSQPGLYTPREGDEDPVIKLWFDFR